MHVARLIRALADFRPLVLVFEDLHWADQSSIHLLESMLRVAVEKRVLFILVMRPGYPEIGEHVLEFARGNNGDRHLRIELSPIDRRSVRSLLRNLLRNGVMPLPALVRIEEKVGGNPFFLEEVVQGLIEEGGILKEDEGLRGTEMIHDAVVPGTVQEVILARIDRLPPAAREVLQVGSVLGRSFPRSIVAVVLDNASELDGELEAVKNAELLIPRDRHGHGLAFKHPLIQEVAYGSILRSKRARLHLSVARDQDACSAASACRVRRAADG